MGILKRFGAMIVAKLSKLVSRLENPCETLDYSYQENLEMLVNVKRGIVDITASKNVLLNTKKDLENKSKLYSSEAVTYLKAGEETKSKQSIEKGEIVKIQLEDLQNGIDGLQNEETALINTQRDLETKLELFKSKKEVLKAQYNSAKSLMKINESISGISDDLVDVGSSIEKIQTDTINMKSRATAIDELTEQGVFNNSIGIKTIDKVLLKDSVDKEFERLKSEL
jgi:phage shock protein A